MSERTETAPVNLEQEILEAYDISLGQRLLIAAIDGTPDDNTVVGHFVPPKQGRTRAIPIFTSGSLQTPLHQQ